MQVFNVPAAPAHRRVPARAIQWAFVVFTATLLLACDPGSAPAPHTEVGHANDHDTHAAVVLSDAERAALGLEITTAGPGKLTVTKSFPGKVKINEERHAHVVARLPGVAASVAASVGESVRAGQTLAVLESRALAKTTAAWLGAREQLRLAHDYFQRIDRLHDKGIATDREHLQARRALAEARIQAKAGAHALRALGFSQAWIEKLPQAPESARFRYPLAAPIDGVVLQRHLTRGEAVAADAEAFEIADLDTVWVDLDIFQRDLAQVREGQSVLITAGDMRVEGDIAWVRPIVAEDTRAALARVVLANPGHRWKPGMFVQGQVVLQRVKAPLVVARTALQTVEGETVVFVQTAAGFVPQAVTTGVEGSDKVAIESGLEPGQRYVAEGAFTLKAELAKGSFEAGHSH